MATYHSYNLGLLVFCLWIKSHSQEATTVTTFWPPPFVPHCLSPLLSYLIAESSECPGPYRIQLYFYILDFFLEKYQWIEVVGRQLGIMKRSDFVLRNCQGLDMPLNLSKRLWCRDILTWKARYSLEIM